MWAPAKPTAPTSKMDSRYTSTAGLGDLNQLSAAIPATRVEVSVSCRNLLDRDTFSKSDPICVLYVQGVGNKEWREFGRTEVIDNTLNPDFVRKFILDYFFEERENLRFDLYDVDSKSPNLSKHDFLGQVFCTLGEIVGSQGSRLEKSIVGIPGKKCGTIILTAEELNCCRDAVLMQFCANKLDKKDFFGKSDPFLVFYRSNEDGSFTICHKTEVVKNTLNPIWQAFKISVRALCNGDYDRTVKVEVYDWDRDGSHDFIGEFTTSYRELSRGQSQFNIYEVINPKKKGKKKKYTNSGTVTLLSFVVETEVSFLDYIKGGTQINFTVAIDFTASNGNPSQPTSLHYMNPYQLNAYGMALKAVGEIVQDYDSDKMFPALGFGAKLPPDGRISHEFALLPCCWNTKAALCRVRVDLLPANHNGNPQNPYCDGIEGVMEAYYRSLKSVQLYGPTNFAPVINHVARPLTVVAFPVVEHRLWTHRPSGHGSRAQSLHSMWDLPRPGHEPVSPASAGRLSTTAPPGKPPKHIFLIDISEGRNRHQYNSIRRLHYPLSIMNRSPRPKINKETANLSNALDQMEPN
ncbi:copine-8 isoform X3 [Tursiops truncatus]|uniref:copine-8 isoform X3 n=1 Tax=Tursiops truncatus TaxID=9739 RepID=UPI003CCF17A1